MKSKVDRLLPVLRDFPYDRIGSFAQNNPYVIAFCYPRNHRYSGGFVVKGGMKDVEKVLRRQGPMLVEMTIWRHGLGRTIGPTLYNLDASKPGRGLAYFWGEELRRDPKTRKSYYRRWRLSYKGMKVLPTFRRIPRKWIPEYDQLLENYLIYK